MVSTRLFVTTCFTYGCKEVNLLVFCFIQDISRAEDTLATLKATQGQTPSSQLNLEITRIEKEIELSSQEKLCYEAQILRVCHSNPNPFFVNTCICKKKKEKRKLSILFVCLLHL